MSSEIRWTCGTLATILQTYLVKNLISPSEIKKIVNVHPKNEILTTSKVLKILEKFVEKCESYGPAQELLEDLETFVDFPYNSKFFGLPPDCLNHQFMKMRVLTNCDNGDEFVAKNEAFLRIWREFSTIRDDGDEVLSSFLMSWANRIHRKFKNCYELVAWEDVEAVWKSTREHVEKELTAKISGTEKVLMRLSQFNVDQLCASFILLFDISVDAELLEELRQAFVKLNKTKPIAKNVAFYEKVYWKHLSIDRTLKKICAAYPEIFQPLVVDESPILRVFEDSGAKFILIQDLEYAIRTVAKNKKVRIVEKFMPKEVREKGFLSTVTLEKFYIIVGLMKIDADHIKLVTQKIVRTQRNVAVPIVSHKGSHCKLAIDTLSDIFDTIFTGLQLFETLKKEQIPKIYEWFEQLDLIKNEEKEEVDTLLTGRFFVELWKIEEMIGKGLADNEPSTEKSLETPKKTTLYNMDECVTMVEKMATNIGQLDVNDIKIQFFHHVKQLKTPYLVQKYVNQIYEYCVRAKFLSGNEKLMKFVCRQGVCRRYRGFKCHCDNYLDTYLQRRETKDNDNTNKDNQIQIMTTEHLEAIHIEYTDSFRYSTYVAENSDKFLDNETCLQIVLDFSLLKMQGADRELMDFVYREEAARNIDTAGRGVFYLTVKEFSDVPIEIVVDFYRDYLTIGLQPENPSEKVIKWAEIWDMLREYFPCDEVLFEKIQNRLKKHPKAQKIGMGTDKIVKLLQQYKKARGFYRHCSEILKNLTNFTAKFGQNRQVKLRMLAATSCEDNNLRHIFYDEVMEALQVVADKFEGVRTLMDLIDLSVMDNYNVETFAYVTVGFLKNYLKLLSLEGAFILVPDIEVFKQLIEFPVKMGYLSVCVKGPNGDKAYHQTHAQFILFQNSACDIDLNMEEGECCKHGNCTNHWKQQVIQCLKDVPNGYVPAEKVEKWIYDLRNLDIAQITKANLRRAPLVLMHGEKVGDRMPRGTLLALVERIMYRAAHCQTNLFLRQLGYEQPENVEMIKMYEVKYVFMMHWIQTFLRDEPKLMYHIGLAYSTCVGNLKFETMSDIKDWISSRTTPERLRFPIKFSNCAKNLSRNENKNTKFKCEDLLEPHHWETRSLLPKSVNSKNSKKFWISPEKVATKMREDIEAGMDNNEKVMRIVCNNVMLVLPDISAVEFDNEENLKKMILSKMRDVMDDEQVELLKRNFSNEQWMTVLMAKLSKFIDFQFESDGQILFRRFEFTDARRKKREEMAKIGREHFEVIANQSAAEMFIDERKNREIFKQLNKQARKSAAAVVATTSASTTPKKSPKLKEQIVTKYVTETRVVDNCEKCDENRERVASLTRHNDGLTMQIEELRKNVEQKEADNVVLKSQITESKTKYRKVVQTHKEDVASRETRIQQLQQELKEYRDDLRVEREKLYSEVAESSRIADENVKKMKIEVENMKFIDNSKSKQIAELTAKNEQLEMRIQICQENAQMFTQHKKEEEEEDADVMGTVDEEEEQKFVQLCIDKMQLDETEEKSDYEQILGLDVMSTVDGIVRRLYKVCDEKHKVLLQESANFKRKFEIYLIILRGNEMDSSKCPDFPTPFSMNFMRIFEMLEKRIN